MVRSNEKSVDPSKEVSKNMVHVKQSRKNIHRFRASSELKLRFFSKIDTTEGLVSLLKLTSLTQAMFSTEDADFLLLCSS